MESHTTAVAILALGPMFSATILLTARMISVNFWPPRIGDGGLAALKRHAIDRGADRAAQDPRHRGPFFLWREMPGRLLGIVERNIVRTVGNFHGWRGRAGQPFAAS